VAYDCAPMARSRRSKSPAQAIAVDLGGTKVAVAAVSANGKIRARKTEPVDTSSTDAPVEQIVRLVRQVDGEFTAMGVAVPGLVRRNGTVWAPNLPGWDAVPLARTLRKRLRVPILVESDRNAAVLGEAWRGAARGKSDVIVLIVGTGIGAGILSGGRIIRGAHELSGCAGWMVVTDHQNEFARQCGSLESLTAGPALVRSGRAPAEQLADAARRGNSQAKQLFTRAGVLLGRAVANLISLFDPEVIVLGGGLAGAADLFLDDLKRVARETAQPLAAPQVEITVSSLGHDANLLGAARLALGVDAKLSS
jgi:glucokinase